MAQETKSHASEQPKYRQVYEHLEQAIISGEYKLGDRLPSESVLVKQFDISRPTAARALRDLEVSKLAQRRHGSGTYVIYSPETKGEVLGLLIPGLGQGEIFEPICNRIAQSVQAHHYSLMWGDFSSDNHSGDTERFEAICHHYIEKQVAGVFFQPIELFERMQEVNRRIVKLLDDAGIPIVLIDADFTKYPVRSCYDLVGIDNRRAGFTLTQHLLKLGRRRIEFVGRSKSASTIDARIEGYRTALFEKGIISQPDWTHKTGKIDEMFVKTILEAGPPEAIVCGNDFTAAEVMRDLLKLGVRVPEDIAIVGIDDLKYASALSVPLTTIHQPCTAIADAAVDTMIWRISNPTEPPRAVLLDFKLVVRESCGQETTARQLGDCI
ncbi:MAG: GntR family transcriptional regulator [Pirellulales bacterium]|nr:GntR family transcriptional regulator [Pirellulales bacterium]